MEIIARVMVNGATIYFEELLSADYYHDIQTDMVPFITNYFRDQW